MTAWWEGGREGDPGWKAERRDFTPTWLLGPHSKGRDLTRAEEGTSSHVHCCHVTDCSQEGTLPIFLISLMVESTSTLRTLWAEALRRHWRTKPSQGHGGTSRVCLHGCICVCKLVFLCVCLCFWTRMYACVCLCIPVCAHPHTYIGMCTCVCVYVRCVCVCVPGSVCTLVPVRVCIVQTAITRGHTGPAFGSQVVVGCF